MRKLAAVALGVAVLGFIGSAAQNTAGHSGAHRTLKVKVHYTGSGTVDDAHKLYVALWDTADFTSGQTAMPVAVQSTASKEDTVTFEGITASPVYVSTAFDPSGKWTAQSAPPSGTSLGMYSKTPPKPDPIEIRAGDTASVDVTFDDRIKVP